MTGFNTVKKLYIVILTNTFLVWCPLVISSCRQKPTEAPSPEAQITGRITDKASHAALPGVIVTTNPKTSSALTDGSGNYTIPNVSAGQYLVRATKGGYQEDSMSVTVTEGSTTTADIQLVALPPELSLSASALDFDSTRTQQSFTVSNSGTGTLNWTVADNQPWISVSPTTGSNNATINVSISRTGLASGNYSGIVSVASNGGNSSVTCLMRVMPPPPPTPVTLQVGTITATSIQLQWSAYQNPSDFAAYRVYYSTSPAVNESSALAISISNFSILNYTVTGLSSNTVYYFRVYVMNQKKITAGSNTVTARTNASVSWVLTTLPVNLQPRSVYYASETSIWLAGFEAIGDGQYPRIYQYDGTQWTQSPVSNQDSTGSFVGIAFRNGTEGWACTSNEIYKYNGSSWSVQYQLSSATVLYEAVGTSSNVWFYGRIFENLGTSHQPIIYQWNGTTFSNLLISPTGNLQDMHFPSNNLGFTIDNAGDIYTYNGALWVGLGTLSEGTGQSASGLSGNDVWAAGWNYLYHYDGTRWNRQNDIAGNGIVYNIDLIRMISSTEGWAINDYGYVYYYDGSNWTQTSMIVWVGLATKMYDFGNGNLWYLTSNNSGVSVYRLK